MKHLDKLTTLCLSVLLLLNSYSFAKEVARAYPVDMRFFNSATGWALEPDDVLILSLIHI